MAEAVMNLFAQQGLGPGDWGRGAGHGALWPVASWRMVTAQLGWPCFSR
jgi:hypothetical protein